MVVLIGALSALSWGCGSQTECGEFPLDQETRRCVVETVDQMVQETFPFEEYKEVDLQVFSKELHGLLELESEDEVFLTEVARTVAMLRDGHTRVEFRSLEVPAVAPLEIERIEGEFVVVAVDKGVSPELVGRRVRSVDGVEMGELFEAVKGKTFAGIGGEVSLSGSEAALAGEVDTAVRLRFEDGREVELRRRAIHSQPRGERIGDFGYIKIDTFGFIDDLEVLDGLINDMIDAEGLIIDLRGNGGGYPSVTDGLFGRLIPREVDPFKLVGQDGVLHRELRARPRGEIYEGPVVVLVDGRTYSASNYLAHRMIHHERGVLLGARTGGGAASPHRGKLLLPGIWFQVSTHVLYPPSGTHSESGLEPMIVYNPEEQSEGESSVLSTLTSQPDAVIQRAIRYLEEGQ